MPKQSSPKHDARDFGLPEHASCPFCGHADTELHSPFGSSLSVAAYWCHRCHSVFEIFKWAPRADDG